MDLKVTLSEFFQKSSTPALFAGAGIAAQAGCRTWIPMLTALAKRIEPRDTPTSALMTKHITANRLELAADLFMQSTEVTKPEALSWIVDAIGIPDPKQIHVLACLPFKFAVTTNYDRALHDAYAAVRSGSAIDAHTFDPILRNAPFIENQYYVARLHGRLEVPESMVLTTNQYADLLREESFYKTFLFYALTRSQLLFIGFSFVDPGIAHVLKVIKSEYPTNVKVPHLALLPQDASPDIVGALQQCNINICRYSDYTELWRAMQLVCQLLKEEPKKVMRAASAVEETFDFAKRYIAACYARARLGARISPLTRAVVEGFVAHVIREGPASVAEISNNLAADLKIPLGIANEHVRSALTELKNEHMCKWDAADSNSKASWTGMANDRYAVDIDYLVEQVSRRFSIRAMQRLENEQLTFVSNFLKFVVLRRGWDLGAAYASGKVPPAVNVQETMPRITGWELVEKSGRARVLRDCIEDLLLHPEPQEAGILADLGRISFACEMVFRSPRDSLLHKMTLPHKIYLDANVLMPALAEGHPYQLLYKKVIERLIDASERSQVGIRIEVLWGFLNEVISHRKKAKDEMADLGSDYERYIFSEASLYGVENMNVFVGAYANFCETTKQNLRFSEYLSKYAPYETEEQLSEWLAAQGITVIGRTPVLLPQVDKAHITHILEVAFAAQLLTGNKTMILVGHDATQLAVLLADMKNSIRSIFVTADQRLRRAMEQSPYSVVTGAMVSHVGLAQLIDLLVGMDPEHAGYTHLIWMAEGSSETDRVRRHLTWMALNEYDAAMALGMGRIIEDYAEDIVADLEKKGIKQLPGESPEQSLVVRKIFGMYEDKFMRKMNDEAEKIRRRLESE